ncbi:MAG: sugar ABC transporter permease [Candidatus Caldatribacterium sp.]|uniref:carbohydrate ABC transporter permease n=1 Tax=Candidatus Caldatribacterium sp. TaxID=2282143 RepID=UPI0029933437|nr:sugar ABC transporter permease [Candidatus Caldatribacterium sp.]MCX7730669.1 sugar ABC transporter permease [Candidatus Caldatribacterium sp.]MDW8081133.1 sugar ABC transporter permease [Candidatus Calescibacterium sp.]
MERVLRDWKALVLFVAPAFCFYGAFVFLPVLWSTGYSFFEGSPISGFRFVGFTNYFKLWQDRDFLRSLWFSARYALVVTSGQIAFGFLLSMLYFLVLNRSSRFAPFLRTLVFFPVVLPTVAVAQMFVKLFEITPQYGLVNAVLDALGLDFWIRPFLGRGETAFWVAATMNIWTAMGFYAVLLYSGLLDIPNELVEAARLDGASGWSLMRFVLTPLLRPLLVTSTIFSLNGTIKVFDQILALTGGGPGKTTTPLTLYMYRTAFHYGQYGYGSAIAVVLTLECLLITGLFSLFRKGER